MNQETSRPEQPDAAPSEEISLYEELGGSSALDTMTDEFYRRVTMDPDLKPFFESIDMAWFKGQQKKFFAQLFGGPAEYDGREMKAAHLEIPIEGRHFTKVAEHLVVSLQSMGVKSVHIARVISLLTPLETEIVNSPPQGDEKNKDEEEINDGGNSKMSFDKNDISAEEEVPPIEEDVALTVEVPESSEQASVPESDSSDAVVAVVEEMMAPIKEIAWNASQSSEVNANQAKELASETTRATGEINKKIEAIRSETEVAVTAISKIVSAINEINDISSLIGKSVGRQTDATNEIARTVDDAVNEVNKIGSANDLQELSNTLMGLVGRIQDN